jgi:hypothetical protein
MDSGVAEMGLPGYPGAPSPPVSWRQVEGSAEQSRLRVATTDRLLREAMAMIVCNVLHPVWVSLKKKNVYLTFSGSLRFDETPSFCFCAAFGLGHN